MLEQLTPQILSFEPGVPWPAALLASWFGIGLLNPLRAAIALATAVPIAYVLGHRTGWAGVLSAGLVLLVLGFFAAQTWESASGIGDDQRIVVDEVAAFLIGAAFIPRATWQRLVFYGAIFLSLDMLKPWPIYHLQGLPGGWGVMLDDVPPALIAGALIFILERRRARQEGAHPI